jgi:hypothetical protein
MPSKQLVAILAVAAALARAEKVSVTAAKKALGDAMNAVKPPAKLPKGVSIDEYGALSFDGEVTRVFDLDGLTYASTPQQIANICKQLSVDAQGRQVPGGPAPPGWEQGQVWNRFIVPLERLVDFRPDGSAIYEQVDGKGDGDASTKYLYPRVRIRARAAATQSALREFHASGPR